MNYPPTFMIVGMITQTAKQKLYYIYRSECYDEDRLISENMTLFYYIMYETMTTHIFVDDHGDITVKVEDIEEEELDG